jgi:hypothetical protein
MPANGEVENGSFVYLNRHSAAHVVLATGRNDDAKFADASCEWLFSTT